MLGELLIQEGITADIIRKYPEMMSKNLGNIQRNCQIYQSLLLQEKLQDKLVTFDQLIQKPKWRYSFLNKVDLKQKQTHIWLHGVANSGKTYIVEQLIEEGLQVYQGPYNDDWIGFDQLVHQVIWFDEFRGQLTIQ